MASSLLLDVSPMAGVSEGQQEPREVVRESEAVIEPGDVDVFALAEKMAAPSPGRLTFSENGIAVGYEEARSEGMPERRGT